MKGIVVNMIYIKNDSEYLKYHVTDDGRLICSEKNGTESVILNDMSNEFDAFKDTDKTIHFVMQGADGELVYLKKENNTWKKYNIFKSRNGIKKIHSIKLIKKRNFLCAFYIMEHDRKRLMIKHRFSADNLYEEPEVLGIDGGKRDFALCSGESESILYYNDTECGIKKVIMDDKFNVVKANSAKFKNEILTINVANIEGKVYAVCTVPKKLSTAMIFFDTENEDNAKIITFGISRNCRPEIIFDDRCIIIEWEENGSVMQSESFDKGKSFSKPHLAGSQCIFADVRQEKNEMPHFSGKCAVYNSKPLISGRKATSNNKAGNMMNTNLQKANTKDFNPDAASFITERLKAIENDIDKMGKTLDEMCKFLDKLTDFKKETERGNFDIVKDTKENAKDTILRSDDIGEIISDNVKLFENTDIDSVLPDKEKI